ncbi:MAG TPA: M56 family metallopeptidase [Puia sp.]|jgi:beta-lactamase regulating signal transducer with metallopeptidase domain|nr:M56 family metallopeptidase [Puia sp.]
MNFIPETIVRALCWTLLHSLWQGLILAVIAGAVMLLTRRASSATRYRILGILIIGFLAGSGYTFFRQLQTPVGVVAQVVRQTMPAAEDIGGSAGWGQQPAQPNAIEQLVQYFNAHAAVVVVVWFIVFCARFVKLLSGLVYAQRIRHYKTSPAPAEWQERMIALLERLRITRPVQLLESALIKTPAVVGWLKPVILVPVGMLAQLSPDQVESILLHELAHICRRDYLFNLVQHVVDTLFFFNPALLWVSSLIRTERENCCDDVAIRETRSRRQLIEALVSFHEYQKSTPAYSLAFAGEHNGVVKRVERIVRKKNHSLNAGERLLLTVGILLLCGAFMTIGGTPPQPPVVKAIPKAPESAMGPVKVDTSKMDVAPVPAAPVPQAPTPATPSNQAAPAAPSNQAAPPSTATPAHLPAWPDTAKPATPASDSSNIDLIIRAHDHGVTPEFIADLKKLGYSINLEQAIKLVDHGVTTEFLQSLQKEGFNLIPLNRAVKLMDHGVTVEFIRHVRGLGFPNLTLEEAVDLVDHGVTADFMEAWKTKTGSKLSLSDYIKLRDAGIDPS